MVLLISSTIPAIKSKITRKCSIEYLGIWEKLNNPDFNPIEFEGFKNRAGLNSFVLTSKQWIVQTNAIGLTAKAGRYGGTFAHKDIAFEFASWISVEFKLYLIKEFQRLQEKEQKSLDWNIKRSLTKINYRIHTDAVKENLMPDHLTSKQINWVYANEADVLNMALFGKDIVQHLESYKERRFDGVVRWVLDSELAKPFNKYLCFES
ncbi:MAG TPA: KilA-N domain-containing protein [Anseongella sp.]